MSLSNHPNNYLDDDLKSSQQQTIKMEINIKPPERYQNLKSLTIKICTLCLSSFYFGYCLVYLSTLSRTAMVREFGNATLQASVHGLFYGLLTFGGAIGAFFSPLLMKRYTRRNLMILLNSGALIVQGMLQYPNIYCLCFCRVGQGYFMGNFIGLLPSYISELSPKQLVANFKIFNQLFFVLGILFAYTLGTFLTKVAEVDDHAIWRVMFGFNILMIVFVLLNCVFGIIPQSPKSYIRKGIKNEAIEVIKMFVKSEYVEEVFKEKLGQVNNELLGIIPDTKELASYSRKAYFIGFLLPIMQPLTGINAIITQVGFVLQDYNFSFGYYVPLIICFVQFWAIYGATYISREFGRRAIILSGSLALGVCDVLIGICFTYSDRFNGVFWIIFVILLFYMVIYGLTLGPVVWMYVPQIIPVSVVPFAATINCLSSTFCLCLSPVLNASLGTPTVYFCFGAITLVVTLINVFGVRQSKGLSPEQIRRSFFDDDQVQTMKKLRTKYSKESDAFSLDSSQNQNKNLDYFLSSPSNVPSLEIRKNTISFLSLQPK